jgi:hypothetical protein
MERGDVYLVSLDPTSGHEQQGCAVSWARRRAASERAMDTPPDIVSLASRPGQGCSGSEAMTNDDLPDRFGWKPRAARVLHQRAAAGRRGKHAGWWGRCPAQAGGAILIGLSGAV